MVSSRKNNELQHIYRQRVVFGFLGVIGVITLVFGFVNIAQTIRGPINAYGTDRETALKESFFSGQFSDDILLRTKDTDQDGISDYDELNLYGTSPYLPDSDSDGFSDSEEIDSGHDPNCPTGSNCRTDRLDIPDQQTELLEEFGITDRLEQTSQPEILDVENISISELRTLLLQSGEVTKEQLDQVGDETLMQVYEQVLGEIPGKDTNN